MMIQPGNDQIGPSHVRPEPPGRRIAGNESDSCHEKNLRTEPQDCIRSTRAVFENDLPTLNIEFFLFEIGSGSTSSAGARLLFENSEDIFSIDYSKWIGKIRASNLVCGSDYMISVSKAWELSLRGSNTIFTAFSETLLHSLIIGDPGSGTSLPAGIRASLRGAE
jgi:hypothetical protein